MQKLQSFHLPPPIEGLNLIAGIDEIKPTEARTLDNYLIYDSGIRQACGDPTVVATYSNAGTIGMQFPYLDANAAWKMLYSNNTKIWKFGTDESSTDITGAATITSDTWYPCYFNKTIFLFNGVDTPLTHDLGAASNVADWTATGPTLTTLIQGFGFKHRLYVVKKNSTTFYYGATDAVAGAFSSYDLGQVFETPGNLLCGFSWTLNQGDGNKDLAVFLSDTGEVLVYDGDNPASANTWALLARGRIPTPSGRQPFVKLPTDTAIVTERGLIPMKSIISGNGFVGEYASISRKVKNNIDTTVQPVIDLDTPFLFIVESDGADNIFVMNYELGSWSRLRFNDVPLSGTITSMAIFNDWLMVGTNGSGTTPKLYKVDLAGSASTTMNYTWTTGHFDCGYKGGKIVSMVRVQGTCTLTTSFRVMARLIPDFSAAGEYDDRTMTVTATVPSEVDLFPSGAGRRLRFNVSRVGTSGEKHEIQGADVFYHPGDFN